jgi:hypothetical protein
LNGRAETEWVGLLRCHETAFSIDNDERAGESIVIAESRHENRVRNRSSNHNSNSNHHSSNQENRT